MPNGKAPRRGHDHIKRPQMMPKSVVASVLYPRGTGRVDVCEWLELWCVTYKGKPVFLRWGVRTWPNHFRRHACLFESEARAKAKANRLNLELETVQFSYRRIV